VPIIKTIILHGRQNIPLRGRRDGGSLLEADDCTSNQGNFRALLNFRIDAGDTELKEHLQSTSARSTYISKTTQNNLIECCGAEISTENLRRIRDAQYWSCIFDETTDASRKEQMTLIVRYVHNGTVREDFLGFVDCYRWLKEKQPESKDESEYSDSESDESDSNSKVEIKLTGKALANIVVKTIRKFGLDLNLCIGIGTDGASVMTSAKKGSVIELQKKHLMQNVCLVTTTHLTIPFLSAQK